MIHIGDALTVLRTLDSGSVQCCVTSPPYWGLRDYGVPKIVWGGDSECAHEWGDAIAVNATNHTDKCAGITHATGATKSSQSRSASRG